VLACKRHGLAAPQGRGFDDLPEELRVRTAECLAQSLAPVALARAFRATTNILLVKVDTLMSRSRQS
jgi:hypothetical protein